MTLRQEKTKHDEFNSETLGHWKRGQVLSHAECLLLVLFLILSTEEKTGGGEDYLSKDKKRSLPETLKLWTMTSSALENLNMYNTKENSLFQSPSTFQNTLQFGLLKPNHVKP